MFVLPCNARMSSCPRLQQLQECSCFLCKMELLLERAILRVHIPSRDYILVVSLGYFYSLAAVCLNQSTLTLASCLFLEVSIWKEK